MRPKTRRQARAAAEAPLKAATGGARRTDPQEAGRRARPDAARRQRRPPSESRKGSARSPNRRWWTTISFRLRVDPIKVKELLPEADRKKFDELTKADRRARRRRRRRRRRVRRLPAFWTVEMDRGREKEPSYILSSGEPDRPEKDKPVEPGWPFAPAKTGFPRRPNRRLRRLADRAGESVLRPRRGQSPLAVALWRRPAEVAQRFRNAGRNADQSRSCSIGWRPSSWRASSA